VNSLELSIIVVLNTTTTSNGGWYFPSTWGEETGSFFTFFICWCL